MCFAMSESINLLESSQSSILNTMTREELHLLVDSLPEAAIEPAKKGLQYFQIWPPQPPPEVERMQQEHREKMLRSMRPGTVGTGGGGIYSGGSADGLNTVVPRSPTTKTKPA